MNRLSLLAAAAALVVTAPALAHTKIVSANPAAGAAVASPAVIELKTSEKLMPKLSGATLTMTSMPGMANHGEMKMPVATSVAKDGSTIVLKPSKKLAAGSYRVDWYAVSGDTHRVTGTHAFSVK